MKRIISIITLIAILATMSTTAFAANYSDVTPDHWAYENIQKISDMGAFSGYEDGTFRPEAAMTHEEFLKTLIEMVAPGSIPSTPINYEKVDTNDPSDPLFWSNHWDAWAQPYLTKAIELGLIGDGSAASNERIAKLLGFNSYADALANVNNPNDATNGSLIIDFNDADIVAPETPITREQTARLATRALYLLDDASLHEYQAESRKSYAGAYNNVSAGMFHSMIGSPLNSWHVTPKYYRDVIVAFVNGIIGFDGNYVYNPQNNLTRDQATTVLLRIVDSNYRFAKTINEAGSEIFNYKMHSMNVSAVVDSILTTYQPNETAVLNGTVSLTDVENGLRNWIANHPSPNMPAYLYERLERVRGTIYESIVQQIYDEVLAGEL